MKSIVLNHYNSLLESENEINVWGWKLHPQANPNNYQIIGDFNNIHNWKAKTLVANNGGKKGEFEDVGYIWFNEMNKTFLPISRNDEHRLGGEMMYDMKYTRKDYYPLWLLGNNYVYNKSDEDKFLKVGKSLMADGWKPHGNISKSGSQIEVPITQFLKTGKIEFQKGILTEKGQQLIDYLTELTKLDTKILKGGSASRMAEKNISKYITKVIEMLNWFTSVDARPNYLLFTHDLEDIVKYDLEQLNKMNNSWSDFEKASKMIFSFHGFKNRIHEIIKETIKNDGGINHYIKSFFGDIDIALGIFNKMDSMNESWHGTMKSLYDYNDIFLNPTKKEMKKDLDGLMRGVILPNGDLYVARAVGTIHRTIIKYLIEKGIIEKQYDLINISRWISPNTDLLFVQNREDDINTFYLAESYSSFWDNDLDDGRLNYLKEIAKKCEAKNNIKIVFKRIWDR
jgi:hypothetical protein